MLGEHQFGKAQAAQGQHHDHDEDQEQYHSTVTLKGISTAFIVHRNNLFLALPAALRLVCRATIARATLAAAAFALACFAVAALLGAAGSGFSTPAAFTTAFTATFAAAFATLPVPAALSGLTTTTAPARSPLFTAAKLAAPPAKFTPAACPLRGDADE
jgi:hypothetical protein